MILRIFLFLVLVLLSTFAPILVLGVCGCAYALRYKAYELIILAACIDGFYGFANPILVPYYTVITCICLIIIEWIKPRISVYNQ